MSLESVTEVSRLQPILEAKCDRCDAVTAIFENFFSFSFFRGKTLLGKIFIKKCLTVIGSAWRIAAQLTPQSDLSARR